MIFHKKFHQNANAPHYMAVRNSKALTHLT